MCALEKPGNSHIARVVLKSGMERNGTNQGSRKLENLFVNSCMPFLIVIQ